MIAKGEALPECDFQIPLMSLPLAFGTTLQTAPSSTPYLKADPGRTREWSARFARGTELAGEDAELARPIASGDIHCQLGEDRFRDQVE